MRIAVARAHPALDARERTLNARAIGVRDIRAAGNGDDCAVCVAGGHQVFGPREDELIRLIVIDVTRQSLVGLARDLRYGQMNPSPNGPLPLPLPLS